MAEISPFRRRMIEDMTVRNLSPATQRSYLAVVSKLSRYFGRSPDRRGEINGVWQRRRRSLSDRHAVHRESLYCQSSFFRLHDCAGTPR